MKKLSWDDILKISTDRFFEAEYDLDEVVKEVQLNLNEQSSRREVLAWWEQKNFDKSKQDLENHLRDWPNTAGPIQPFSLSAGEIVTLNALAESAGNQEKIIAILMAASLYPRFGSGRSTLDREMWPRPTDIREIAYPICEAAFGGLRLPWSSLSTWVLPSLSSVSDRKLNNDLDIIHYCLEECIAVLDDYQIVRIKF